MKHVKVQVTQDVNGIEVFGVTFIQDSKNENLFIFQNLKLLHRESIAGRDRLSDWSLEFPGGSFVGWTPEECVEKLRHLALDVIAVHWLEEESKTDTKESDNDLPF